MLHVHRTHAVVYWVLCSAQFSGDCVQCCLHIGCNQIDKRSNHTPVNSTRPNNLISRESDKQVRLLLYLNSWLCFRLYFRDSVFTHDTHLYVPAAFRKIHGLGRIRFDESESGFRFRFFRFSESVHSMRKPESGFANLANPVLTWIASETGSDVSITNVNE